MRLSRKNYRDLEWWTRLPESHVGRSLWTSPTTRTVSSDASGYAWGGIYGKKWAAKRFNAEDSKHHITVKELIAAHKTICVCR